MSMTNLDQGEEGSRPADFQVADYWLTAAAVCWDLTSRPGHPPHLLGILTREQIQTWKIVEMSSAFIRCGHTD